MSMFLTTFLHVCLLSLGIKATDEDHCVWYGECGTSDKSHPILNCLYEGPAKPLESSAIGALRDICPELVNESGNALTCCDASQIATFERSSALAKHLLQRCPVCWNNFRKYLCAMACSPQQSRYLHVQETVVGDKKHNNQVAIKAIEYKVSNSYAGIFFDSCKDVTIPMMGNRALDMMCGDWNAEACTAERWLTYLGDADKGFAPFLINVTFWDEETITEHGKTFKPLNLPVVKCSQSINGESRCACDDCKDSCTPSTPHSPNPRSINNETTCGPVNCVCKNSTPYPLCYFTSLSVGTILLLYYWLPLALYRL